MKYTSGDNLVSTNGNTPVDLLVFNDQDEKNAFFFKEGLYNGFISFDAGTTWARMGRGTVSFGPIRFRSGENTKVQIKADSNAGGEMTEVYAFTD